MRNTAPLGVKVREKVFAVFQEIFGYLEMEISLPPEVFFE